MKHRSQGYDRRFQGSGPGFDPELLKKAHEEYVKTTGGKYICPVPPETVPLFD